MRSLRRDGRLVVLAALVAYAAILAYPHYSAYEPNWTRMGVSDTPVRFADMRSVTSGWECVRKGEHVLVHNPCDPLGHRPANYPNLWMRLAFLGLGPRDTTALGLIVGVVFLASIFFLAGPLTLSVGLLWSALVTSPSVMLGINRGNVDLFLFAALVFAVGALARAGRGFRVLGCALIEVAALLKLFPIFAAAAVLHWRRRPALLAFAAMTLVFAAYALMIRHEIQTIRSVVPASVAFSFGAGVIIRALRRYGETAFFVADRPLAIALLALLTLAVSVAVAVALAHREQEEPEPSTRLIPLWAGAPLVVGCWVFTETSFDYRLAFCLLAVPQLLEWAGQRRPAVPLPRTALLVLVAGLWLSDTQSFLWPAVDGRWLRAESVFPFDELLVWGLVVYLTVALLRTLPPWLVRSSRAARSRPVVRSAHLW
jgi:hypothetical protein